MNDDLISRQAAIDALDRAVTKEAARWSLQELPSAERRGRWIDIEHAPNGLLYATCSVCGNRKTIESVNYCGECGARMEAKE